MVRIFLFILTFLVQLARIADSKPADTDSSSVEGAKKLRL